MTDVLTRVSIIADQAWIVFVGFLYHGEPLSSRRLPLVFREIIMPRTWLPGISREHELSLQGLIRVSSRPYLLNKGLRYGMLAAKKSRVDNNQSRNIVNVDGF